MAADDRSPFMPTSIACPSILRIDARQILSASVPRIASKITRFTSAHRAENFA
jgi:hypothetical protein